MDNLETLNLNNFDTSNVESMSGMFNSCQNLITLDLRIFNTSKVTDMRNMFYRCSNLTTIFASEKFVTTEVIYGDRMFNDCLKLVGGYGTTYDENHTDYTYAKIDKGISSPGYFTFNFRIDNYILDDSYIKGIQPNTKYKDFVKNIYATKTYMIKEGEKVLTDTDIIKTGQILIVGENIYTLVVIGDTNGDGKANIKDILQINKHRLKKMQLTNVYLDAGDVNNDGKVNIQDIMKINKYRLGKISEL